MTPNLPWRLLRLLDVLERVEMLGRCLLQSWKVEVGGHDDYSLDAGVGRSLGDSLRIIALRIGNDPARAFIGRQRRYQTGRAPDLERSGRHQVSRLDLDRRAVGRVPTAYGN
jgi:hypothetical protein